MDEMLDRIFGNLQQLEIQPTEHNVGILADCFRALREIYNRMARETGRKGPQDAPAPEDRNIHDNVTEAATEAENGEE